jgi:XTP/dITP diphosphohydrolase
MLSNMNKKLLIATNNLHKKDEIQQILGPNYAIESLKDVGIVEDIVEDGDSFEANALIKAKYCFDKTGTTSLGDDSGLVVEALDGRPGIFSARYASNHDFELNMEKVLQEMEGIANRRAYFVTVLCFYNGQAAKYYEGRVYGQISHEKSGNKGFGYDPIFIPDGHQISFADMPAEQKNKISHRAKAFELFLNDL